MPLQGFYNSSRSTSPMVPPSEDMYHEGNRLSTFGRGRAVWNGNHSALRLSKQGFYHLDENRAECRFCSRVVSDSIDVPQHHTTCGIPHNTERQNVSFRDRDIEDENGEMALRYLSSRKREKERARQSDRYSGGVEVWPVGLIRVLLEKGYQQELIGTTVEDYFDMTGLFPDSKQLLLMLQSETRERLHPNNNAI